MTAVLEFQKLEATGVWQSGPDAQRRDVFVALGETTLTMTDRNDVALAHWSLAAVARVGGTRETGIYAPGPDSAERLEISDETMLTAIEKVRLAVERSRPRSGRVRLRLLAVGGAAAIALGAFWLPEALMRYTASIVPEVTRIQIGADLMEEVERVAGAPCDAPEGLRALDALQARLGETAPRDIAILPAGVRTSAHLPGGVALFDRATVEDHETPEALAGYILAESERAARTDPLLDLLHHAGLGAAISLMTSGSLPPEALAPYAREVLTTPPEAVPADALLERFAAAGVPATPYAYAVDISGETTLPLIEADRIDAAQPVLSDDDWVALQEICAG